MSIRQKTLASVGIIVMVLVAVMTTTTYFSVTGLGASWLSRMRRL